jgi:hypothetical protein
MPGGKVMVEGVVADDEAKQDVGVRRYRYMVSEGVKGVGGQTWAPLAYAINAMVAKEPMPYFPVCVMAKEAFQKGKLADSTFATAYSPWTVGYMAGQAAIKTLGKKRIFFLARADSWGWDMRDGAKAAAQEYGAEMVGYDEVSLGTGDFTTVLQKVRAAKPDVFGQKMPVTLQPKPAEFEVKTAAAQFGDELDFDEVGQADPVQIKEQARQGQDEEKQADSEPSEPAPSMPPERIRGGRRHIMV